jgi:hypothetical protein
LGVGGADLRSGYVPFTGGHDVDPVDRTVIKPKRYRGHRRGWSDGNIEWLTRGTLYLAPAQADSTAAYRAGKPGAITLHSFF